MEALEPFVIEAGADFAREAQFLSFVVTNEQRAEITARGGTCTALIDKPYGMREILVTTVDGHRIVFGQEMKNTAA